MQEASCVTVALGNVAQSAIRPESELPRQRNGAILTLKCFKGLFYQQILYQNDNFPDCHSLIVSSLLVKEVKGSNPVD